MSHAEVPPSSRSGDKRNTRRIGELTFPKAGQEGPTLQCLNWCDPHIAKNTPFVGLVVHPVLSHQPLAQEDCLQRGRAAHVRAPL